MTTGAEIFFQPPDRKTEIIKETNHLVAVAKQDALDGLPNTAKPDARDRVITAVEQTLRPHILESEIIADQIGSPAYREYIHEQQTFLHQTRVGVIVCPDGRILAISIMSPRIAHIHRRLRGMPETRQSTRGDKNVFVLDDPMITGSITTAVHQRKNAGEENPEVVEFFGPHINSKNPKEGCGKAKSEVTKGGRPAVTAMTLGGIPQYYDELGNGFTAADTVIDRAGGKGATFDMSHDIYSQGLIFGLRDAYLEGMLENGELRETLERLHKNRVILMTELLDEQLEPEIMQVARTQRITQSLQLRRPEYIAQNIINIGNITREITQRHERRGYPFIPRRLIDHVSDNAARVLAYHAIHNSVYRKLGAIVPGKHELIPHPEQLIRVGPIGAAFNVKHISFNQVTPHGLFRPQDIAGVHDLYNLSETIVPGLGIDLRHEARIILVTGEDNTDDYKVEKQDKALNYLKSEVNNNVATLKEEFPQGVANGETVVIGALHHSESRRMTHMLSAS